MRSLYSPFSVTRHLDFWSVAAFGTDDSGNAKGSQGEVRPRSRPADLKAPTKPVSEDVLASLMADAASNKSNDRPSFPQTQTDTPENRRNATALANLKARSAANLKVYDAKKAAEKVGEINSNYESLMNRLTPYDGKEYIGGRLVSTKPEGLTGYQPGPTFPGVIGLAQGVFRGLSDVGEGDTTVNTIDGKDIYERYDGTTYSVNMLGLPYDTVSKDSLEAKPMSSDQSEFMTRMMADASKNDAPVYGTNLTSAGTGTGTADPCPEGYRMNPETNACEIDPFQTPFPTQGPLPADPGTPPVVAAAPSSPYTAATPYNLAPLAPSAQPAFVIPTPNVQPITVAQQTPAGLAGLPFRRV